MNPIQEFLSHLNSLDIKLWVDGDRLRCNAPKGTLTKMLREELTERKAEIVSFLQEVNFATGSTIESIRPISKNGDIPLSFAQERLWLLAQLEEESATYNMSLAIHLKGSLNSLALEKAITEIVKRHEVLRTTFKWVDDKPVQVINSVSLQSLPTIDLQNLPKQHKSVEVQRLATEEALQPFNLVAGPLVRIKLLQLEKNSHVLLLIMHHIISDGWSMSIFIQELSALYPAYCVGEPSPLAELPIQYADFAYWQRQLLQGEVLQKQLYYWQQKLAGAPPLLELPTDHPRPPIQTFHGATETIVLSETMVSSLNTLSHRQGVTLFATLLAALNILMFKWTGQADIVIGTIMAGRNRVEIEPLIGCFINFLALRSQISGEQTAEEFISTVGATVVEAYSYQDCPFEKLVEVLNLDRQLSHNPVYNTAFLLHNFPLKPFVMDQLEVSFLPLETKTTPLDLRFMMCESSEYTNGKTLLTCEYNTDLFEPDTIKTLLNGYCQILEILLEYPETILSYFKLPAKLESQARAARESFHKPTIAISASFTIEPLRDSLSFWLQTLEMPWQIKFAPYNQVFQQLLDPASQLSQNQDGINVVLVRFEDWLNNKEVKEAEDDFPDRIALNVQELVLALQSAVQRATVPYLVCLCPPSPTAIEDDRAELFSKMEGQVADELSNMSGIYLVTSSELLSTYPVSNYYDPHGEELGHIPYTSLFFAALGTAIARRIHLIRRSPYKVIALDCDQTLWKGVCGEDGAEALEITAPYQALQRFMLSQQEAGKLICLCSKNNEQDVWRVFELRGDMILKRHHLVSWRLNWQYKSENLKSLAEELQLGLDSFIFIDDNPVECAEVRANCPEVLTIQLPQEPKCIPQFLEHIWAFDYLKITREDRLRTVMYRQKIQREHWRQESLTFKDFIAGLKLEVEISQLKPDQVIRASQLTQRTNQFNLTNIRRREAEIQNLCESGQLECMVVEVKDRFGDYGLVGVLFFESSSDVLRVDTFLLSCRVLGRGVEHRMLSQLGVIARQRGVSYVDISYIPTQKNQPALDFLEGLALGDRKKEGQGLLFKFSAQSIADLSFESAEYKETEDSQFEKPITVPTSSNLTSFKANLYESIATELAEPEQIFKAAESKKLRERPELQEGFVPPRDALELQLAQIWADIIGIKLVGVRDKFFNLGGNSLMAVRLMAQIQKQFGKNLPLATLFQNPTIEKLASLLRQQSESLDWSCLVAIKPGGSKQPLFCIHPGGGNVLSYFDLSHELGSDQPFYGLQSIGLNGEAEPLTCIEDMATHYLEEIQSVQPQGPYNLAGWSFGGIVAYEIAQQLYAKGHQVSFLGLLDTYEPSAAPQDTQDDASLLVSMFIGLIVLSEDHLRQLDLDGQLQYIVDQGKKSNFLPPDYGLQQARYLFQVYKCNQQAEQHYCPQPYIGDISLFVASEATLATPNDPTMGWSKLVTGGIEVYTVPGTHQTMVQKPNVHELAKQLMIHLE